MIYYCCPNKKVGCSGFTICNVVDKLTISRRRNCMRYTTTTTASLTALRSGPLAYRNVRTLRNSYKTCKNLLRSNEFSCPLKAHTSQWRVPYSTTVTTKLIRRCRLAGRTNRESFVNDSKWLGEVAGNAFVSYVAVANVTYLVGNHIAYPGEYWR